MIITALCATFILLAFGWAAIAFDYFGGALRAPRMNNLPAFETGTPDAPAVSVVFAACDEEAKVAEAFRTLLAQNYPGSLQIVAVDDRSSDATPRLLDGLQAEAPPHIRVAVLHLTDLPPGWLGKNHALYRGAERASGDFLLFTDADVKFAPDALSRAVRYAEQRNLDHLVAFFGMELFGFWENAFGLCFSYLFFLRFRPWRVADPKSRAYVGIGGFNMVKRAAYDAIGTHRALALEVADDMELGHKLKAAGFASGVIGAENQISVRWQEGGLFGLMNGLTKNAYAGLDYSVWVLFGSSILLLATVIAPVVFLLVGPTLPIRAACAASLLCIFGTGGYHAKTGNIAPLYALTLPISTLLLIWVMIRSAYLTEKNGGVTWRGTLYPLVLLRSRAVPPLPPPL